MPFFINLGKPEVKIIFCSQLMKTVKNSWAL